MTLNLVTMEEWRFFLLGLLVYLVMVIMTVRYWLGKWMIKNKTGLIADDYSWAWCLGFLWPISIPIASCLRFAERHPDIWRAIWYRIPNDEKKRIKIRELQRRTKELERELKIKD